MTVNKTRISLCLNDLRLEPTDVIVNAANSSLLHGGGLARALVLAGGTEVSVQSADCVKLLGQIRAGETCFTSSGELKARKLLHTVGPRWYDFEVEEQEEARTLLRECVESILTLSSRLGAGSISIPPVSSGLFGYPKTLCAEDMLNQLILISQNQVLLSDINQQRIEPTPDYIRIVMFDQETLDAFIPIFERLNQLHGGPSQIFRSNSF